MEDTKTSPASNTFAIPGAIIVAGLIIAAAIIFGGGTTPSSFGNTERNSAPGIPSNITLEPITEADHIRGNPQAKVFIVEYSDLECPYCKVFHTTMNQIMAQFGAEGEVAWVYRHFPLPFHVKAFKEAEATECVARLGGNTQFWQYVDTIFRVTTSNDGLNLLDLPVFASGLGIDEDAFNTCLESGEMSTLVEMDMMSGNNAGVSGTPHSLIVVNGKIVDIIEGAQSYLTVKAQIEKVLR